MPPDFAKGTVFRDSKACSIAGRKPKYFIGLNDVSEIDENEKIVCFVFNSENKPEILNLNCNKEKEKFFFPNNTFSFQNRPTSLMLNRAVYYHLSEMYGESIDIKETIDECLARQIKNCIKAEVLEKFAIKLINDSFKIAKK